MAVNFLGSKSHYPLKKNCIIKIFLEYFANNALFLQVRLQRFVGSMKQRTCIGQ